MRMIAIVALLVAVVVSVAAPAPKEGPPRVLLVSSNKSGNWEIYLVQPDSGETKNLTNNKASDFDAIWSPDGKRIAFLSDREGKPKMSQIWLMNADGTEPKQLTKNPGVYKQLRWSPDGKLIAFVIGKKDESDNIYTADVATGKVNQVTNEMFPSREPVWSPDSKKLVYSYYRVPGMWGLHMMDADGAEKQDLTAMQGGIVATWSPNGKNLAFTRLNNAGFCVYTINAIGTQSQDLGTEPSPVVTDARPQWSPNGITIAYAAYDPTTKKMQVGTVNADGTKHRILTADDTHSHPQWSPDGKSLSYGRFKDDFGYFHDDQSAILFVSDADGKNPKELIRGYRSAEWKPK